MQYTLLFLSKFRHLYIFLALALLITQSSFAQSSGHEGSGGGGGIACFESAEIAIDSFDKGLLKRNAIDKIKDFFLLDFYEPQNTGWAQPLDMLYFTSLLNLSSVYNIREKDQTVLNEYGYRSRGTESFEKVKYFAEKFYIYGIDQAIKKRYSPLFFQALLLARQHLPFSKWIDSRGPISEFQDRGLLKANIPSNCGYVQVAVRSRVSDGWQVVFDKELVEKKFSAFMLAMLRFHEEIYLVGELLYNFQKNWSFFNSEKVRSLTQTVFSGAFHSFGSDYDYCQKYLQLHQLLADLQFTDGLEKLIKSQDSFSNVPLMLPKVKEECLRVIVNY